MNRIDLSAPFVSRRGLLGAFAGAGAALCSTPVLAAPLLAEQMGLSGTSPDDQTASLQGAIDKAVLTGQKLVLPAGTIRAGNLVLPAGLYLEGVRGNTRLIAVGTDPIAKGSGADNLTLSGLIFDGDDTGPDAAQGGLVAIATSDNVAIADCGFVNGAGNGLFLHQVSGRIADCRFDKLAQTALFSRDARGLIISGNRITGCGNGGIRVFRSKKEPDGTIVSSNQISGVKSGSGNGQNGNGINVFRAGNVIVANNAISDCDFSAVRLNGTNDAQVTGNNCSDCREVAIFSEFDFSGSIVANNAIDKAATGISITNFNKGGRLAVCANNLVRNILPASPTNPDARPVGIHAQADCAITGNTIDSVPGVGILAGWGPYLKNVLVSNNAVADTLYGIGASVAPGAGSARIAGNLIFDASKAAISGFAWAQPKGTDLSKTPDQFANLTVSGNTVS